MKIEQWLDSQLGIDIWNNKYKFENENFEEWLGRVSNGNEDIAQLIREKKFLFGGRILANRGLDKKGNLLKKRKKRKRTKNSANPFSLHRNIIVKTKCINYCV